MIRAVYRTLPAVAALVLTFTVSPHDVVVASAGGVVGALWCYGAAYLILREEEDR